MRAGTKREKKWRTGTGNREFRTGKRNVKPIGRFSILGSLFPVFHFLLGARLLRQVAMNPDGTALEQLTDAQGLVIERDGSVIGELSGPHAYGPHL